MVDAVTSQTLVDGERNVVMKFTNISDGNGESAVTKVDVSALSGAPSRVKIVRIWGTTQGMSVDVLWDADTDVVCFTTPESGEFDQCFKHFGGLQNNAGAGVTGDIKFTTTGHASGDRYTIILEMQKS